MMTCKFIVHRPLIHHIQGVLASEHKEGMLESNMMMLSTVTDIVLKGRLWKRILAWKFHSKKCYSRMLIINKAMKSQLEVSHQEKLWHLSRQIEVLMGISINRYWRLKVIDVKTDVKVYLISETLSNLAINWTFEKKACR